MCQCGGGGVFQQSIVAHFRSAGVPECGSADAAASPPRRHPGPWCCSSAPIPTFAPRSPRELARRAAVGCGGRLGDSRASRCSLWKHSRLPGHPASTSVGSHIIPMPHTSPAGLEKCHAARLHTLPSVPTQRVILINIPSADDPSGARPVLKAGRHWPLRPCHHSMWCSRRLQRGWRREVRPASHSPFAACRTRACRPRALTNTPSAARR